MDVFEPRVGVPKQIKKGDVIEITTLLPHRLEGDENLKETEGYGSIPYFRKLIARFNGKQIFSADIGPNLAAHPFIAFNMKAERSGYLEIVWVDYNSSIYSFRKKLEVAEE